ncbi:AMP-binding protein [Variovorax saccharolyticus]|uniref:AMP-binding protein n=1 Tax=Variovorax saccharolyticus TaxID=3053516 RepID=UPI002578A452|nr:AMP-binding protein [Variovorax sp. J22R187]MDM0018964.1 AMP-binding protein [Variovorax sp. J22R187]
MAPAIYFDRLDEADSGFQRRLERSIRALHQMALGPGKVIALMLHNEPVVLELMLAARAVGAHFCPINWHFKADEVGHVLRDSGASVLIIHGDLVDQIAEGIPGSVRVLVAEPRARTRESFAIQERASAHRVGQEAWESVRDAVEVPIDTPLAPTPPGTMMAYTSGTTGLPKGVRRSAPTPEQVQSLAEASRVALGIATDMRALVSAPLYHSAPANYVMQAALKDAHIWIEPRFDAQTTLKIIESEGITHAYLVPTMFNRLLRLDAGIRSQYRVDSLRFVACTGAPLPAGTKARMIDWWGPVIHESYAASELGWITHIDSHEALRKPGSVGRAIPGTVIRIYSDAGVELPVGKVGLIHARSSAVPDFTYANNSEARRQVERDGLWTLRDVGYLDEDGYLHVVDRQSDMVISGGVNIYPAEIEATLATLAGVADCAVFGVPDDEFGESLVAAIQPAVGADLQAGDVQAFLRHRLANYKVPRSVLFVADLPREDTGKIFKRRLKEQYLMSLRVGGFQATGP